MHPVPALARVSPDNSTQIFLNYVAAMNQVQEKVSAVIHNHDVSDVAAVTQRAMQVAAPDARSTELRNQLLTILSKVSDAAAAATPAPGDGPRRPPQLDQKLVDERNEWRKEYDEWLKGAAKVYNAPPSS